MAAHEPSLERKFHATVYMVEFQACRGAHCSDVEEGLADALRLGKIKPEHEQIYKRCKAIDDAMQAGQEPPEPVTAELCDQLQMCVMRLNSAEPA